MIKAKLIVILTFLAVFGAGSVSTLVVASKFKPSAPANPPQREPWLVARLGITVEQANKIESFMSDARETFRNNETAVRSSRSKLQSDLLALLTPEQRKKYDDLLAAHEAFQVRMRAESEAKMEAQNKAVLALLTPEQQKKWEEIRQQRGPGGGPRNGEGRGRGGPGSRPTSGPSDHGFGGPGFGPGGPGFGPGGPGGGFGPPPGDHH